MAKIFLTREGYEKLREELNFLRTVKRMEIAKHLEHARSMGDLRENAEYDSAKDAQAHLEKRISELENKLGNASLIDEEAIDKDRVLIGAKVTIMDLETKEECIYTLVSQEEADFSQNKISISSPVGKALLGHRVDEAVEVKIPKGTVRYKILKIER
ncbi:MAG: transcription elongation factor GreA [Candidatus Omnitrophica bacterium]|nr:transcription elongation factor GreA [Candidatus Omnitrophota bacterium]